MNELSISHPSSSYRHGLAAVARGMGLKVQEPDDYVAWAQQGSARILAHFSYDTPSWEMLRTFVSEGTASVVALIPEIDEEQYARALSCGADGVAHVHAHPEIICDVIVAASRGETLLPAEAAKAIARHRYPTSTSLVRPLDKQEVDLVVQLAQGATTVEIAARSFVSERTMRRRMQNTFLKLDAKNRAQAIAQAARLGLLPDS